MRITASLRATFYHGNRTLFILGNPPYNLRWWVEEGKNRLSQFYYCIKAAELLKPLGILAIII